MLNEQLMLSLPQVLQILPISKGLVYSLMKKKGFPRPKKIEGCKKSFWDKKEIISWVESNLK